MNHRVRLLVLLPLILLAGACASNNTGGPATEAAPRRDPNLLTSEDMTSYSDARAAILSMRNQWLRVRAAGSFDSSGRVEVYRDGVRVGGVDILSTFQTSQIEFIRYYDGITASQRWGLGHENGVIYVTSKNGTPPLAK